MRTLTKILAASVVAAGLSVAASANATIYINVAANGGALTTVATDPTNTNAFVGSMSFGNFTINNISATGAISLPDLLSSNSLNTSSSTAGYLDVWIVETDLLPTNGFVSSLTSNTLPAGWSVTERTYLDTANSSVSGAGVLLASHVFNSIGTSVIGSNAVAPSAFALSQHYHIVSTGRGTANSTIDISAVPEPATWAMMLVGFGGLGAMLRNRRRTAAVAA